MKVTTNPEVLFDHATTAFYAAAEDTLEDARANVAALKSHNPKTGSLQTTLKMWRRKRKSGPTATIGSRKSPYASILERGGGPAAGWKARGPHVQRANAPRPITRAAEGFGDHFEKRLRSTPIRTSAVMLHGAKERGPSELLLGANP